MAESVGRVRTVEARDSKNSTFTAKLGDNCAPHIKGCYLVHNVANDSYGRR